MTVRTRDSQRARETILNAAEEVFAQHGFDGGRMDAIAQASGYNISLPFQYFGDKLGLYAAVLGRAHRETTDLQARVFRPLLADDTVASDDKAFRAGLETAVQSVFVYLDQHPRLLRILTWEMADGWQKYAQVASQFPTEAGDQLEALFKAAWKAGLLRSDASGLLQLTLIFQVCQSYLAFLPMYELVLPGQARFSGRARARVRKQIVGFIVGGLLVDRPQPGPRQGRQGGKS